MQEELADCVEMGLWLTLQQQHQLSEQSDLLPHEARG